MTLEEFEAWAKRMQERHEALAESLEILSHDVQELKSTVQGLIILFEADHKSIVELRQASFALLGVVQQHEQRITKLEGQPPAA